MKRRLFIALFLLAGLLLTGCCYNSNPADYDFDREFSALFKHSDGEPSGKKTACYNGRIYYLSDESGEPGLHSMLPSGSDVRLELRLLDIRALLVEEDAIWCSAYVGITQPQYWDSPWRSFRLFRIDRATGEIERVADTPRKQVAKIMNEHCVCGIYRFQNGMLGLQTLTVKHYAPHSSQSYGVLLLDGNGPVDLPQEHPMLMARSVPGSGAGATFLLWRQGDALVGVRTYYRQEMYVKNLAGLFDLAQNREIFPAETAAQQYRDARPFHKEENVVYIAYEDEIEAYHMQTGNVWMHMQATDGEWIEEIRTDGMDCLLTAGRELWRIDLKARTDSLILTLPEEAVYVSLTNSRAIAAKGKKLLFYDLTGEQAEQTGTMELATRIVDRRNKVECAGGWLFLYRFNDKTMRDELAEKVRIG